MCPQTQQDNAAGDVRTFLNDLKILILPLHNLLEITKVLAQVCDFAVVKLDRVCGALFNIEAGADIDDHTVSGGEASGDVEGLCYGNEDLGALNQCVRVFPFLRRTRDDSPRAESPSEGVEDRCMGGKKGTNERTNERTFCLPTHAILDAVNALAEAGLGGAQARVGGREVFEFLGQAGLQGRELRRREGEDVDGARGKGLDGCHCSSGCSWCVWV
jgi:hypothetical protein